MKGLLKISTGIILIGILFMNQSCKTNIVPKNIPFSIDEKTYFYWVGGKEGTRGTTIRITGISQTTNLYFSKVYFQNYAYEVIPRVSGNDFVLSATKSEFTKPDRIMSGDPKAEYGNQPPPVSQDIPFELEDDEAVLLYSVNGLDAYHKITGLKELETVYRP